jgi:hypothetical protein
MCQSESFSAFFSHLPGTAIGYSPKLSSKTVESIRILIQERIDKSGPILKVAVSPR